MESMMSNHRSRTEEFRLLLRADKTDGEKLNETRASTFTLGSDSQYIDKSEGGVGFGTFDERSQTNNSFRNNTNNSVLRRTHRRNLSSKTWLSNFSEFLTTPERRQKWGRAFFPSVNDLPSNILLGICYLLVIMFSMLIFMGPLVLRLKHSKEEWCETGFLTGTSKNSDHNDGDDDENEGNDRKLTSSNDNSFFEATMDKPYPNPDYDTDPCRYLRVHQLCYFTLEECDICRRLLASVILGGAIGYERRSADRPAGIRTMGLVSLGACFFTISSILAFKSSTQTWDASRVTAALPSGVGFLGGALIWKGTIFVGDHEMHQVHGLTTAASLWLSAAVGVGVGGALYFVTIYVTILVVMILRYGPRTLYDENEEEDEEDDNDHDDLDEDTFAEAHTGEGDTAGSAVGDVPVDPEETINSPDSTAMSAIPRNPSRLDLDRIRRRSMKELATFHS